MQKKLLALAISAITSAGAFAQTNVQIYGIVDYGYTFRHDRNELGKLANISKTNSRFDSGQSAANRLGFKGVEDLGNGLKAVFVLERGFALDTGSDLGGFNRQAYVGLSGNYGTIVGGLVYTPYYTLVSGLDPFADGTVGNYHNIKYDVGLYAFNPVRVNNAIAYISPNWGGFNFSAAFSNNGFTGDDDATKNANNDTVYALAANYVAPNWNIGLSYHHIAFGQPERNSSGAKNVNDITIGGAYDFKTVKVSGFISYDRLSVGNGFKTNDGKSYIPQTNFMLGAVAPFGKHAVKASFNYSHNSSSQNGKAWQLALGYDYNFSKRTNFYAAYAYINADKPNANGRIGRIYAAVDDASNLGAVSGSALDGAGYKQGFQLGIKHSF